LEECVQFFEQCEGENFSFVLLKHLKKIVENSSVWRECENFGRPAFGGQQYQLGTKNSGVRSSPFKSSPSPTSNVLK